MFLLFHVTRGLFAYRCTTNCYEALRLAKIYHSDGPSSAGMVSHFKDSTTTSVRAGKLRNLTAQALDVKWHPAIGRLHSIIIFMCLLNLQNQICLHFNPEIFGCLTRVVAAFRHWIATASYAGEVVLWNVERNNDPSAKGTHSVSPSSFSLSHTVFLFINFTMNSLTSMCKIHILTYHTSPVLVPLSQPWLPTWTQHDECTHITAIAERQFKQPGSISLNIGSGRLCWTADPHLIVSCFRDNYVRLWVSTLPSLRTHLMHVFTCVGCAQANSCSTVPAQSTSRLGATACVRR